jgi:hypothetical protein
MVLTGLMAREIGGKRPAQLVVGQCYIVHSVEHHLNHQYARITGLTGQS